MTKSLVVEALEHTRVCALFRHSEIAVSTVDKAIRVAEIEARIVKAATKLKLRRSGVLRQWDAEAELFELLAEHEAATK